MSEHTRYLSRTCASHWSPAATWNSIVSMATIHISEADAVKEFAHLMSQVRAGMEVVIDSGTQAVAILRAPGQPHRSISDSIALADADAKTSGTAPIMDSDFAQDMEEIVAHREARATSAWD